MGNTAVYAIKIAITVATTMAVVVAINGLISGVATFATNTPLGEIIALISIYLPFSSGYFFGIIGSAITAMLAFIVAKKIYELTMKAHLVYVYFGQ